MLRNKKEKYGKFGSPEHIKNLCDELADCQLTLIATFGYLGLDINQVNNMILEKLGIVEDRVEKTKAEAKTFASELVEKITDDKKSTVSCHDI